MPDFSITPGAAGPTVQPGSNDGDYLTWNSGASIWQAGPFVQPGLGITAITENYTLDQSDQGKVVVLTGATNRDVTVPPFGENAYFATGAVIYLATSNTGHITIVEGAGVTVHGVSTLNQQGVIAMLINIAQDEWVCHH